MAKSEIQFLCTECGDVFPKWFGQCPSCGEWNTLKEFRESKVQTGKGGKSNRTGVDLTASSTTKEKRHGGEKFSSGVVEFDRVVGEGFFPGEVILFGGAPGVGKSTLALQIFLETEDAFYFTGEESEEQVLSRAERVSIFSQKREKPLNHTVRGAEKGQVFSTHSIEDVVATVEKHHPRLAVVDSIQMIGSDGASLGQISSLRENAEVLLKLAKATGTTILLIGHVTKNDELAGPRILEHLVDCVLYLEGEKTTEMRILRAAKNRFGSTLEVGVFAMTSSGLSEVGNPSEFFLSERPEHASGSAITVVREGSRNFLMELQALTVKTNFGQPRRTSHGVDLSKFHLMLAVVSKFTPFGCMEYDAYLNIAGGLRVKDPACDLAVCAAILGSRAEKEIPADTIIFGEVGLSGEVRNVPYTDYRLREAEKMGFKRAIVPRLRPAPGGTGGTEKKDMPKGIEVVEVKTVLELLRYIVPKEIR